MTDLPTVWRRVIIPAYITFEQLHRVIQHVMPWQDYHLYYFSASDDNSQFTNDQDGIGEYEYYRKNPAALEGMKDWDKAFFSEPRKAAWEVKIGPVLEKAGALDYVYDFGDHWEHRLVLEAITDCENDFAVCIDCGEAFPPEDVGGPGAYMDFLEAWHDPRHSEHNELVTWGISMGFTGKFDQQEANKSLEMKLPLSKNVSSVAAAGLTQRFFPTD